MYVVQLMDKFSTSFPLLLVVLLEMVVISWIYGTLQLGLLVYALMML